MMAIKLLVLSLACVCATAIPNIAPAQVTRNTIFADERFEGEVFENVDAFANLNTELQSTGISPYRLPTTTKPSAYRIFWKIDMFMLSYSGEVAITLAATEANVNQIVIHSNVTITEVELRRASALVPTTYTTEVDYHFLKVNLTDAVLAEGVDYVLTVKFNANMRDDMYGIYYSWYRNNPTSTELR